MDSKEKEENKEKVEVKDESAPKPINNENKKEQNISKINKILSDSTTSEKVFDLLFVIDATGSMSNYITAAKDETENISKELRNSYPEYHFQYGYVFYRDPIDSHDDKHEVINLTDQVNSLPEQIKKIKAYGGGDMPEDWVGAYKLVNEKINWRNGLKVIIHLADAGAHGKEFTLSDKYPEESIKLKSELLKVCQNGIKIFGYVITEDARHSFNECQNYYRSNGGSYEICDFKIAGGSYGYDDYSDSDDDIKYKSFKKGCKKKVKAKRKEESEDEIEYEECKEKEELKMSKKKKTKKKCSSDESDEDKDDYDEDICDEDEYIGKKKEKKYKGHELSSKQGAINSTFKTRVLKSVKSAMPY